MKILVVDDDFEMREMLKALLRRDGHEVETVEDGERGVAAATQKGFDLVLMDMVMPRKEGLEAILDILHVNPEAKIIAMSGGTRAGEADFPVLKCGAVGVMTKPFQPAELRAAIAAAVEKSA